MSNQGVTHKPWMHIYHTWSAFVEDVKTVKINRVVHRASTHEDESDQATPWSGIETMDKALKVLDTGWSDGITKIRELQRIVPPDLFDSIMPVEEYKPQMQHNVAGGALDVGTFITGATPANFVVQQTGESGEKVQGRKLVSMYVNITNACFCNADAFMYRGMYAFTMIEHMENCGYSVELWAVLYEQHTSKLRSYIKVKEYGEMFDANKLALALCAPFMLRRYVFRLMESYPNDEADICNHGYGYPVNDPKVENIVLPDDMDLHPMWIHMVNVSTPTETLDEYRKILEKWLDGGCFAA